MPFVVIAPYIGALIPPQIAWRAGSVLISVLQCCNNVCKCWGALLSQKKVIGAVNTVYCKTHTDIDMIDQDHNVLPGHSSNFILPFHRLAVLILRRLDHSMSTRLAILPKQRQPHSIAGPLRDRPGRFVNPLPIIIDLGSLCEAVECIISIESFGPKSITKKQFI